MAQNKYDLCLVPTINNNKTRRQPWYRERLQTELTKLSRVGAGPRKNACILGTHWSFLVGGLDDFRDGLPPDENAGVLRKVRVGSRTVPGMSDVFPPLPLPLKSKKQLSKYDKCFAKCTPNQHKRRNRIEGLEEALLSHPLALYPQLVQAVEPRVTIIMNIELYTVFEDVVNLLDPSMNKQKAEVLMAEKNVEATINQSSIRKPLLTSSLAKSQGTATDEKRPRCSYVLPKSTSDGAGGVSASDVGQQNEQMRRLARKFYELVRDVGPGSYSVEEPAVLNLFTGELDNKPAMTFPIHVVSTNSVPSELKAEAGMSQ
ncbi:PREDICTED: protein FAM47E-like [Priapulus caudatus]|uniref:Protein FAM47E-like n=1 Tax=Priapulus caudatus TaxID=37621 RepID=A0ABM1ETF1_PRICU|nr:PREDICTED: protein FAM47E-like [Priapulus caudatus]